MQKEISMSSKNVKLYSLEKALSYKNDTIIYKFLESYNMDFDEAEDLFIEMKKWLWLCGLSHTLDDAPVPIINSSLIMLDKMWHTFILFTRDYQLYCLNYVGHFIHHFPTSKQEKELAHEKIKENEEKFKKNKHKEYSKFYTFIYDNLGEKTLVKWFSFYLETYTAKHMESIFKNAQ